MKYAWSAKLYSKLKMKNHNANCPATHRKQVISGFAINEGILLSANL